MTAIEIWIYDTDKKDLAESHGYEVYTIWESDYNSDIVDTMRKCFKFIDN